VTNSPHGKAILDLVLEILKTAPKLQIKGDKLTQDIGLTSSRWWCLVHISESDGGLTVADVARRMNLQRQTVQRFVEALFNNEMIRYHDNPDHNFLRDSATTEKGKEALVTIEERELQWAEGSATSIATEDIQTAINTLTTLRDEITAQYGSR